MVKVPIGKIEKGLVDKSKQYKKITGVKTVELVETLLTDFFNGKILTNDYITLEEPLYFNSKELFEEGSVKCSLDKPTTDLDNVQIIKRVPNNLDSINDNLFYSYEDYNTHKGIDFSVFCSDYITEEDIKTSYLVFDLKYYNFKELVPDLTISCLKTNELSVYLDINESKDIIKFLYGVKNKYLRDIERTKELKAKHSDVTKTKFENLPEEVLQDLAEIMFNISKWLAYNYNCFIPVKLYSKIQQIIILLNEGTEEESKKLEKMLDINKYDLEDFIENFKSGRNTNMAFILFKLNNESINGSVNSDLNFMVNAFINGESNIVESYISYILRNNY